MKALIFAYIFLFFPSLGYSTAAKFLELGFGSKYSAMADCAISNPSDISSTFYNPASWNREKENEWAISHSLHIQDTKLSQAIFSKKNYGFIINYFSAGEIEGRNESQQLTGNFKAYDMSISAGYGIKYSGILYGINLKFIQQKIKDYSGSALASDLGLIYEFENKPFVLGSVISNLGSKLKFEDSYYSLPLAFKIGGSYYFENKNPAVISAQIDIPKDEDIVFRIGGEYNIKNLSLRLGWKSTKALQRDAILGDSKGIDELYGFYFGFGVKLLGLSIDYALLPYGELGSAHRFTIGGRF